MCPRFFFPETTFFIFKWESLELFEFHFCIHSTKQRAGCHSGRTSCIPVPEYTHQAFTLLEQGARILPFPDQTL